MTTTGESPALLEVTGLVTEFATPSGRLRAVDEVGFVVRRGETLGIVGESGCGKSVTSLSLLRLIADPPGRITGGSIRLEGRDLLALDADEIRAVRGREIAMIFQEPMTSLNPVFTIGAQIIEAIRAHESVDASDARARAIRWLERVGIPAAAKRFDDYPHQLSGGMRQRVMIAMALSLGPKLLIADEPTTALDVTIQAQILALLKELQRETGMALILITHDLSVVSEVTDRLLVMYAGRVVESGPTQAVLTRPKHPYTRGLLRSIPQLDSEPRTPLKTIAGRVPDLRTLPVGCRYRDRCEMAIARCAEREPELRSLADGRQVRCVVDL